MEIPALQGLALEQGLMTMEQPLRKGEQKQRLRIGVPREMSNEERRVALAPSGVEALVASGHEVYVEQGAGAQAHFTDNEYAEAGADLSYTPEDLYSKSNLIAKVGPPGEKELDLLQEKQLLISALHLGNTGPDFLRCLMDLGVTGIGFEFIRDSDGTLPIVRMMHEIMGSDGRADRGAPLGERGRRQGRPSWVGSRACRPRRSSYSARALSASGPRGRRSATALT